MQCSETIFVIIMKLLILLLAILALIIVLTFTRHLWEKPKDKVDMIKKFDTIIQHAYSIENDGRLLELRDNFVKVGTRNANGQKAYMVKQRPGNEFRVLYECRYDREYCDFKFNHVYPDSFDQSKIIEEFEKEIKSNLVKRKQ